MKNEITTYNEFNNKLDIYEQFDKLQGAAVALYKSGYFSDARNEAQAIVKVMAGAELGLPPFASMTGVHIIQGKPAIGANVIATIIKNDRRYDYKVVKHDETICVIQFYEHGKICGTSEFTLNDAKKAGTKNLDKFPKNMLFARAISNGAKWYVPGIFGGSQIYTTEELGANINEDGEIIDIPETQEKQKEKLSSDSERWAAAVQAVINGKITIEKIINNFDISESDIELLKSDVLDGKE